MLFQVTALKMNLQHESAPQEPKRNVLFSQQIYFWSKIGTSTSDLRKALILGVKKIVGWVVDRNKVTFDEYRQFS